MPVIPSLWEAEIRRIAIPGQSQQKKVWETPSQWKKLCMVACGCHLSNGGTHKIGGTQSRLAWAKRETLSPK
jgi:hypothetical protein